MISTEPLGNGRLIKLSMFIPWHKLALEVKSSISLHIWNICTAKVWVYIPEQLNAVIRDEVSNPVM